MFNFIEQYDYVLLLRFIVAHLATDFLLQTDFQVEQRFKKRWGSLWLYIHSILAGIVAYVFVGRWTLLWVPFTIAITHILIDGIKSKAKDTAQSFLLDQIGHLVVILICWMVIVNFNMSTIIKLSNSIISNTKFWTLILLYSIVIWPAGIWIGKVTEPWRRELQEISSQGLEKAGLWIGRLERVLIITFVLISRYEAIGFLIAAKSIFRFGEIRTSGGRKEAEYILIGTMISFITAIILGIFAKYTISLL